MAYSNVRRSYFALAECSYLNQTLAYVAQYHILRWTLPDPRLEKAYMDMPGAKTTYSTCALSRVMPPYLKAELNQYMRKVILPNMFCLQTTFLKKYYEVHVLLHFIEPCTAGVCRTSTSNILLLLMVQLDSATQTTYVSLKWINI